MDIPILYEDEHIIIINKPSGLIVNRAKSYPGPTLQEWADEKLGINAKEITKWKEKDWRCRSGIVHRLDKETSGCLVIAKSKLVFGTMIWDFRIRRVLKEYLTLVHGKLDVAEGEIDAPIARLAWNSYTFGVTPGGKEAHTKFQVSKYYQDKLGNNYTLVKVFPTSGRTHQIRVHMKYLDFPVVADYLYGGRKQRVKDRLWCPRTFLHASCLAFIHPVERYSIEFNAPLADDLKLALANLVEV